MEKYILSLILMALLMGLHVLGQSAPPNLAALSAEAVTAREAAAPVSKKKKKAKCCPPWQAERPFRKGQFDLYFNTGLVPTFLMDKAKVRLPPLALGSGYRFNRSFSLSAFGGHSVSESQPRIIADDVEAVWTNRYFNFSLRPGFHISRFRGWDLYGGFALGVNWVLIEGQTTGTEAGLRETEAHLGIQRSRVSPAFSGFVGGRYVLNPKWTLHGELGYGLSLCTLGLGYMLRR